MRNIEIIVEGMHCTGCSNRLERVLKNIDGVENARVSLEEKKAYIEFLDEKVSIENLKEAINDAGFEVKGE